MKLKSKIVTSRPGLPDQFWGFLADDEQLLIQYTLLKFIDKAGIIRCLSIKLTTKYLSFTDFIFTLKWCI